MSYAQCPICALRFRYQSELEAHAHDDHCPPAQVTLPPHAERRGAVRAGRAASLAGCCACPDGARLRAQRHRVGRDRGLDVVRLAAEAHLDLEAWRGPSRPARSGRTPRRRSARPARAAGRWRPPSSRSATTSPAAPRPARRGRRTPAAARRTPPSRRARRSPRRAARRGGCAAPGRRRAGAARGRTSSTRTPRVPTKPGRAVDQGRDVERGRHAGTVRRPAPAASMAPCRPSRSRTTSPTSPWPSRAGAGSSSPSGRCRCSALLRERFARDRPLAGLRVAACAHVTPETAALARTLTAGGAVLHVAASNPLSTQDDVAAALVAGDGVAVQARHGVDRAGYVGAPARRAGRPAVAAARRRLRPRAGAARRAQRPAAARSSPAPSRPRPACCGCVRCTPTARCACRSWRSTTPRCSCWSPTGTAPASRCSTRSCGPPARCSPARSSWWPATAGAAAASPRAHGGWGRRSSSPRSSRAARSRRCSTATASCRWTQAAPLGDVFLTTTGNRDVLTRRALRADEGRRGARQRRATSTSRSTSSGSPTSAVAVHRRVRPQVDAYELADGRRLLLLAEGRLANLAAGEGHPPSVMDISFAVQALTVEWMAGAGLAPGVHDVPAGDRRRGRPHEAGRARRPARPADAGAGALPVQLAGVSELPLPARDAVRRGRRAPAAASGRRGLDLHGGPRGRRHRRCSWVGWTCGWTRPASRRGCTPRRAAGCCAAGASGEAVLWRRGAGRGGGRGRGLHRQTSPAHAMAVVARLDLAVGRVPPRPARRADRRRPSRRGWSCSPGRGPRRTAWVGGRPRHRRAAGAASCTTSWWSPRPDLTLTRP